MLNEPTQTRQPTGNRQTRRKARKLAKRRKASGSAAGTASKLADPRLARAKQLICAERVDEAKSLLSALLAEDSSQPVAHNLLGQVLDWQDQSRRAYRHHKQAVALAPDNALFWSDFGRCLLRLRQGDASIVAYRRAIALRPDDADCYMDLGKACLGADRPEAAVAAYDKAIALQPDLAVAYVEKAAQLQLLGDFDGARSCCEQALRLDPGLLEAHDHLIKMGKLAAEPSTVIAQIEEAVAAPDVTPHRRMVGCFALAKLHEREGDHDSAFDGYARANDILRARERFNRPEFLAFVDQTIEGFGPETFRQLQGAGSPSDVPVFIVGMPRSGTTLVEQIIASHPGAFAGGEIRKLAQLAAELAGASSAAVRYPRDAGAMRPGHLSEIGRHYLSHLHGMAPADAARITDKLPFNFYHLGLVSILFPNAAIVHCRRDPMDTCLSCYFQSFTESSAQTMTNDLADLGFLYRQYDRLMDLWRAVLPSPILDVRYEELIENQEAVSRRLLEFVGLEWDDACLRFHASDNSVMTASMWQLRQPI